MFVFMLPNFFVIFETGIEWDLFFTGIHPVAVVIVVVRAIGIKAWTLERQGTQLKDSKDGKTNISFGTELSDQSSSFSQDNI